MHATFYDQLQAEPMPSLGESVSSVPCQHTRSPNPVVCSLSTWSAKAGCTICGRRYR